MKIFWNITLAELKSNLRNIVFVVSTILLPVLLILLFGGLYGNDAPSRIFGEYGAVDSSAPAYIALAIAIIGLTGLPLHIVGYKENKVLKRLKATPVKSWQILVPIFLNYFILLLAGMILMFLAGLIFGLKMHGNFFAFALAVLMSVSAMFSLGFLLSCVTKSIKQITAIGFSILIPVIFLSGATMPLGAFPDAMQNVSKAIPLTYCVEFMQNTFLGKPFADNWISIAVLLGITVISTVLSLKFFKWE